MTCICRDDLFAGDCPTACLVRWATDREGSERVTHSGSPSREGKHRCPPAPQGAS